MSDVSHDIGHDVAAGSPSASLNSIRSFAGVIGFLGLVGIVAGYIFDTDPLKRVFWAAYCYGFFFWLGLTLGCTTMTYLHHTIRAQWSLSLLKIIEAGNQLLPVMAIGFLPLLAAVWFGNGQVYPWADSHFLETLHHNKQVWFNKVGWSLRAIFYFAYWIVTTRILNASSWKQDETRDEALGQDRSNFAPPAGVIHVVLLTFATTDWIMSLNPLWFSTLYGAWYMATQILATISFGTALILILRKFSPFHDIVSPALTRDLGNLMLAFTMIYGYFSLSQFLIIWSANLPEEIMFFTDRFSGPMVVIGGLIVFAQFFGPFLALISGKTKRTPEILQRVAIWIFVIRMVDMWWQIVPFFKRGFTFGDIPGLGLDLAGLGFFGGVWLTFFLINLRKRSLVTLHDTRLQETRAKLEAASHA